jgi:hypothetical protein
MTGSGNSVNSVAAGFWHPDKQQSFAKFGTEGINDLSN